MLGILAFLIIAIGVLAALDNFYVGWLWFGSVKYRGVYSSILATRFVLFVVVGAIMGGLVGANVVIAFKTRSLFQPMSTEQQNLDRYRLAIEPRRRVLVAVIVAAIWLFAGLSAQGRWQTWMLWRNAQPFGQSDPQYHRDISYYAFTYPFQRMVLDYLFIAVLLCMIGALAVQYLFGSLRISTPGPKVLPAAKAHLSVLLGIFVVLKGFGYWLDRYGLLFSSRGGTTGASYTDVHAVLPAKTILMFVAAVCAIAFIANVFFRNLALPAIALVLLLFSALVIGTAYPAIVQQFSVKPNANNKEKPYISRNIAATSAAYGIGKDNVSYQGNYAANTGSNAAAQAHIKDATGTIQNARLLDPNVLSATFDQQQRILSYYSFPDKLDIDRYGSGAARQDYIVGARELDPSKLTGNQHNWINQHLVYTHGNGFVAAPANQDNDGSPIYTTGNLPTTGNIPVSQGDIYYGEKFGQDYSIVGTKAGEAPREFDRPGGSSGADVKTTYAGSGGVKIGSFFRRLVFAGKYQERNILFSSAISSTSKILYDRDPRQMVQQVAPFLKVDGDPYPAVINGRIEWIVDCYTTSDGYPYSQQETLGDITTDSLTGQGTGRQPNQQVNYIRNSVKATVDAYNGTVTLYQFDKTDPVLNTWMKAFPKLIKPESMISSALRSHFRYPEDLFKVQRDLITQYHVTDPVQFYNSQNFWSVPNDPTRPGTGEPQPPYYILAQGPGQSSPTFQLTSALNFQNRSNMAAFVSVDSDPSHYGHFTVLELPSGTSVSGPGQAQSQFQSNPDISSKVGLLSRSGSNVVFGNLLTLPVAGGLLYVEPLYVQGNGDAFPLLRYVMVQFGSNIGFAPTLAGALTNLFSSSSQSGRPPPSNQHPSSSPSSSSTAPPSSTAPSGSVVLTGPKLRAYQRVQSALTQLQEAYQSGDPAKVGQAEAKLKQAVADAEAAGVSAPGG